MKLEFEPNITSMPLAENIVVNAVVSDSNSSEVDRMLRDGIKAAQSGQRAEARQLLLNVTEADNDNENAWLWLASISEYPEELLVFLNNVLKINPENERAVEWIKATKTLMAKTFVQRGIDAAKNEQAGFARQCFLQAIVQDDKSEMAWLWLASVTEQPNEKVSHLQKVLNINPENENALSSMKKAKKQIAQTLVAKVKQAVVENNRDEAKSLLQKVLQDVPNSEDALLIKAYLADSFSEKTAGFEKVLEINSENETAKADLAYLRSIFADVSKASEQFEELEPEAESQTNSVEEVFEDFAESETAEAVDFDEQNLQAEEFVYETTEPEEFFTNEESVEYSAEYEKPDSDFSAEPEEYFAEPETPIAMPEQAEIEVYAEPESDETEYLYQENEQPENAEFADAAEESFQSESVQAEDSEAFEEFEQNPIGEQSAKLMSCPFCNEANEPQSFVCKCCNSVLSLSDIELMIVHDKANRDIVQEAVRRMEAEKESREFDAEELKSLGIGYLNLRDLRRGFSCLQEAVRLNPEGDVVLISQVDALAIRIAEIEHQEENKNSESKCANILVVDDSPTVRKLISSKLEKCGHEVICAVDGMDALAKIEESVPDLILLDITMPRMDGYQVCKQIRSNEATQNIPIVMISGNDGFFDKVRGKMAGTTNYITKPFGPETLMKTVNEYIQ